MYEGTTYSLPDSVDIRSDSSSDTIEFLNAFTKLVMDFGLNEGDFDGDTDDFRLCNLWNRASDDDLAGDQLGQEYWLSDSWLICAGRMFGLGVKIRVLIDEGGENESDTIYNAVEPPEGGRIVNATSHVEYISVQEYAGYHFDMKPRVPTVRNLFQADETAHSQIPKLTGRTRPQYTVSLKNPMTAATATNITMTTTTGGKGARRMPRILHTTNHLG